MGRFTIHHGDCLDVMPTLPEASVDSIVTDPPYGLSFMGKDWDHGVPGEPFWREALRVAKPGAFLLAFGGTRTFHRMTCAIEDAGWQIRDCIMWVYGSGFPKSKSCLKPAWEPVIVARRPGPMQHLQIDRCRIGIEVVGWGGNGSSGFSGSLNNSSCPRPVSGRWPANLIHDGSDEVVRLFPHDAARFFYCAKANRSDREAGLRSTLGNFPGDPGKSGGVNVRNTHPTVKPTDLMRYLCRLVTAPGGTVLDPFTGSGSTGKAAMLEGLDFIGIEREEEYVRIAEARIRAAMLPLEEAAA